MSNVDVDGLDLVIQEARARVVAEARSWLGTPYHHLGDVKGVGVDCAMLLVRCYVDTGVLEAFDPRPYSPQWHQNRDEERYLGWLERVAVVTEEPVPGDVAVFRFGQKVRPFSHGAILVEGDQRDGVVVHALRSGRMVMPQRLSEAPLAGQPVKWYSPAGKLRELALSLLEGA